MTLTLLVDLDDTLLVNDMDIFIPAYLKSLSGYMAAFHEPKGFVEKLLAATDTMVRNNDPGCSLKETFDKAFYPALGLRQEAVAPALDTFYRQVFPSLAENTQPVSGAANFINTAFQRGCQVVIATNPLFPCSAIQERLKWAGVPVQQYPYAIVTAYENFHFAKPNPAYYAEILANLGWPDGPVVMLGNDPVADIQAAQLLGLATYRVDQAGLQAGRHGRGPLGCFFDWLDETGENELLPIFDSRAASLASLRATAAVLPGLLDDLDDKTWRKRPQENEWSLVEVLCHLRDVEAEVNLKRLNMLLHGDNPFMPAADPDPWAKERQYLRQDGMQACQEFCENRKRLLDLVETLHEAGWQRSARHAIFGPTTLQEIVSIMAGHDRLHVRQIFQTLHNVAT